MGIKYTQIFFDEEMRNRKENADITWNEAAFLGIKFKEKLNEMGASDADKFLNTLNQ